MPIITIRTIEGYFSAGQKADLIREVTDAVARVADHENISNATRVLIEEVPDGHWGVGGNVLTLERLREVLSE